MAFNVRITGRRGIHQTTVPDPIQDSKDSVYVLWEPYEFALVAVSNGSSPVTIGPSGLALALDYSKICRVEIPSGQAIRYEINPPNRNVAAGNVSPIMMGIQNVMWGAGYSMSFVDATFFL